MALLIKMLRESAVYWPPVGIDPYGKPMFGAPIQITCRWEESNDEVLSADGEKTLSRARVFVGQDVQVRGMLFEGKLEQVVDQVNPLNNTDIFGTPQAFKIIKYDRLPDLKARRFLRTAYLT